MKTKKQKPTHLTLVTPTPIFKAPDITGVLKKQAEFAKVFHVPLGKPTQELYVKLIEEEHEEWVEEYYGADTKEYDELKELGDVLYVTAGLYWHKYTEQEKGLFETNPFYPVKYILPKDETWDFAISKLVEDIATGHSGEKKLLQLIYCLFAYAEAMDYPLMEAYDRIHHSNLSKLDDNGNPVRREDNKILKGPNYKPPYLEDLTNGK